MKRIVLLLFLVFGTVIVGCATSASTPTFDVKKERQEAAKQLKGFGTLLANNAQFSTLDPTTLKRTLGEKLSDYVTKDELSKMKSEVPQWLAGNFQTDIFYLMPDHNRDKAAYLTTTATFTDSDEKAQSLLFQLRFDPEANVSGATVKMVKEEGKWKIARIITE
ncbi:DUF3828 domain-containing protein [Brochothrix thermosphacta]|uniref:DUF3828 domain-containing protein n=1 Tax=Brochothrix thermosphacta TaxID=2756 RepID=UPI0039B07838